jgi:uncharacterized protein (DUF2062 family)
MFQCPRPQRFLSNEMPKHLFKRYTPDPKTVREHKHLRLFARFLEDPNLFHMNRRSVSGAFAAGLFWAMIPIPVQMIAAALTAIIIRINLPISVALVWLTNPVTMPPVFYFNYLVGTWILGAPPDVGEFHLSMEWIGSQLDAIWLPLYLGSLVVGTLWGIIGYLAIRGYWRWHMINRYRKRPAAKR